MSDTLPPLPEPAGAVAIDVGPQTWGGLEVGRVESFVDGYTAAQLRAYALQAVAVERERCAAICEGVSERHQSGGRYRSVVADHAVRAGGQIDGAEECAEAIRAAGFP